MSLQPMPPFRPGAILVVVPSIVEASSGMFSRLVKVPLSDCHEKLMSMPPLRRYLAAAAVATCVFWIAPFKIIPFTKSTLLKLFLGNIPPTESGSGFNIRQKLWYSCVWLLSPKHPKTYSLQDALPSLPVPDLNQTCRKFLESVRPLLTDEEYAVSKQKVEDFRKKEGKSLHNDLWKYSFTVRNWVEQTWEWGAYLSQRSPLPVYSNWYGIDGNAPDPANRFVRLASLVIGALKFKKELDSQSYETLRMSLVPICMYQYTRLFGTSRNPGLIVEGEKDLKKTGDYLVTKSGATSIQVMCRGEIYIMQVINKGCAISLADCIAQFEWIAASAQRTPEGACQPPIGLFTSQRRDDWAIMRQQLMADKTNADSFNEIENTLFCVCLDDSSPANDQEMSQLTFIGNGHNRYYDRNFMMVSFANGQTCVNSEHTWADALIVSDLFDHINETADEIMKKAVAPSKSLPEELVPKRLCWVMSATTGEGLEKAKQHYTALRDSIDICAYKFNAFGKTAISKNFGLSPDAFIQMAMQLAHLRLHRKVVLTYESSHTRRFWHGRTEAVRSASSQSTAFAKAMDALNHDDRDTKKYLLQQACEAHVNTIKQNMAGQGFDRHMLMLKVISMHQKLPLPEIYRDKAWMMEFELSTSQTPSQRGSGGGFGPVAPEGYGVSYLVKENYLYFHISSWKSSGKSAEVFGRAVEQALLDMQDVCQPKKKMARKNSEQALDLLAH